MQIAMTARRWWSRRTAKVGADVGRCFYGMGMAWEWTMGGPWENHGKPWENGGLPSGELTKQLNMAIEIVDFPIKNGDFPLQHVTVHQRVEILDGPYFFPCFSFVFNCFSEWIEWIKNYHATDGKGSCERQTLQGQGFKIFKIFQHMTHSKKSEKDRKGISRIRRETTPPLCCDARLSRLDLGTGFQAVTHRDGSFPVRLGHRESRKRTSPGGTGDRSPFPAVSAGEFHGDFHGDIWYIYINIYIYIYIYI